MLSEELQCRLMDSGIEPSREMVVAIVGEEEADRLIAMWRNAAAARIMALEFGETS